MDNKIYSEVIREDGTVTRWASAWELINNKSVSEVVVNLYLLSEGVDNAKVFINESGDLIEIDGVKIK